MQFYIVFILLLLLHSYSQEVWTPCAMASCCVAVNCVLAAPFKPSRAEPEPVADECGFSILLARDGKVPLGEVIRSQWSLSD